MHELRFHSPRIILVDVAGREEIRAAGQAEPISHYTDAVRVGDLLFVSGCVPVDADGRLVGGDDVVVAFVEGATDAAAFPLVSAGVYAVRARVLKDFPEGVFLDWGKDVFPRLLAGGGGARILGYRIEGYCLGLDTPASYERGLALISSGQVTLQ